MTIYATCIPGFDIAPDISEVRQAARSRPRLCWSRDHAKTGIT
jgi:hypothetical protein